MVLPAETVQLLALVAVGGVALLSVVVLLLMVRLSRLRKAYAAAIDPDRREDLFEAVQRQAGDLSDLRRDLEVVNGNTETLRTLLRSTVSRVGVVRYDAFEDMGGALSFSAALLDEDGHGLVLSAINGRSETRVYAKPLRGGASDHNLSEEEEAAIEAARTVESGELVEVRRGRRGKRAS